MVRNAKFLYQISQITGIAHEELVTILEYLKEEKLIHPLTILHASGGSIPIQILHKVVLEIEAVISKPNESTEHFPSQIFNITNNSPVSAQQFGNQNVLNVQHQSNLVESAAEIQRILKQLEQSHRTTTFVEQAEVTEKAIEQIKAKPALRQKIIATLKTVGEEAFKETIDHPLANIFMTGIKTWLKM